MKNGTVGPGLPSGNISPKGTSARLLGCLEGSSLSEHTPLCGLALSSSQDKSSAAWSSLSTCSCHATDVTRQRKEPGHPGSRQVKLLLGMTRPLSSPHWLGKLQAFLRWALGKGFFGPLGQGLVPAEVFAVGRNPEARQSIEAHPVRTLQHLCPPGRLKGFRVLPQVREANSICLTFSSRSQEENSGSHKQKLGKPGVGQSKVWRSRCVRATEDCVRTRPHVPSIPHPLQKAPAAAVASLWGVFLELGWEVGHSSSSYACPVAFEEFWSYLFSSLPLISTPFQLQGF